MSASSKNTDNLLNGQCLLWVECAPQQWWPVLRFKNYAQAMMKHGKMDARTKTLLTIKFLEHPLVPMAQLVDTMEFVELMESTETRDFYNHMASIYNNSTAYSALAQPMKIVTQLLNEDLEATEQERLTASIDEEEEEGVVEIDTNESWKNVWRKLQEIGWKAQKTTQKGNICWVFPGSYCTNGVPGQDYFNTIQELQEYV